jgi:hypothetical protein
MVYSKDDFYVLPDNSLVVMETTNGVNLLNKFYIFRSKIANYMNSLSLTRFSHGKESPLLTLLQKMDKNGLTSSYSITPEHIITNILS